METAMEFTVGLPEILTFAAALSGAGWALITLSLNQFEKRQEEKFKTLDLVSVEIKRLEIEIIRSDARASQIYSTKVDQEKALEKIFHMLENINACLAAKINREEVHAIVVNSHKQ
jgi:septal ring factor EnvC (AmiA/AmiB activator)